MSWACGMYGWGEGVYRVLVGKPEGKRPLRRPSCRWVDNIRMDLQEVGCGHVDWIGLAQVRDGWRTLVSAVMNLRVPWNAGNFLTRCKPVSCSGRTLHHGVSKYVNPWIKILLMKLLVAELVKKFPKSYGIREIINESVVTLNCPYLGPDQSMPATQPTLILSFPLCLDLTSCAFPRQKPCIILPIWPRKVIFNYTV